MIKTIKLAGFELRRFKGPLPIIALLFLLLVPSLYGALYLWSNWDPYGRLDQVPIILPGKLGMMLRALTTPAVSALARVPDVVERSRKAESILTATIVCPGYYELHELLRSSVDRSLGSSVEVTGVVTTVDPDWGSIDTDLVLTTIDPGASGDAGGIAWVELTGDADRLGEWLGGGEELPLRYVAGEAPGLRAARSVLRAVTEPR